MDSLTHTETGTKSVINDGIAEREESPIKELSFEDKVIYFKDCINEHGLISGTIHIDDLPAFEEATYQLGRLLRK